MPFVKSACAILNLVSAANAGAVLGCEAKIGMDTHAIVAALPDPRMYAQHPLTPSVGLLLTYCFSREISVLGDYRDKTIALLIYKDGHEAAAARRQDPQNDGMKFFRVRNSRGLDKWAIGFGFYAEICQVRFNQVGSLLLLPVFFLRLMRSNFRDTFMFLPWSAL